MTDKITDFSKCAFNMWLLSNFGIHIITDYSWPNYYGVKRPNLWRVVFSVFFGLFIFQLLTAVVSQIFQVDMYALIWSFGTLRCSLSWFHKTTVSECFASLNEDCIKFKYDIIATIFEHWYEHGGYNELSSYLGISISTMATHCSQAVVVHGYVNSELNNREM